MTIGTGYSAFAPTFKSVGKASFYLADLIPMASATEKYNTSGKTGVCKGNIRVQLLSDAVGGSYSTAYYFYSSDPNSGSNYHKWYKLVGGSYVEIGATEVSIPAGTGFAVNNLTGAPSYIQLKAPVVK
jgi:hypothetical protein